ncbi:MAG: DUF456 domain-containing protein [Alistipes sp.]|nr:DUF456 domain-containing protein [Alistipes sp.]
MDITLAIIAVVAGIIGLIGVIVPVLPGTILSYAGLVCLYFTTSTTITITELIIWGAISVIVMVLDYILPGYFSQKFGATKAGVWGATIGTIVGIFFGVPGILLGPFVGAVVGEKINGKLTTEQALKVGFGSMISFIVGSGLKLVVGAILMFYIIKDVIVIFTSML